MMKIISYIENNRNRYKSLSRGFQLFLLFVAIVFLMVGILLLFVLPELGIPLLLISSAVLSLEFIFAQNFVNFISKYLGDKRTIMRAGLAGLLLFIFLLAFNLI